MNNVLTQLYIMFMLSSMNAYSRAVDLSGGIAGLAKRLQTTPQRVWNWGVRGVPADRVIIICSATDWVVTPHELRPDIYPHPEDGLPNHLRRREEENES